MIAIVSHRHARLTCASFLFPPVCITVAPHAHSPDCADEELVGTYLPMVEPPPASSGGAPGRNADGTWSKIDTSKYIWAREGGSGIRAHRIRRSDIECVLEGNYCHNPTPMANNRVQYCIRYFFHAIFSRLGGISSFSRISSFEPPLHPPRFIHSCAARPLSAPDARAVGRAGRDRFCGALGAHECDQGYGARRRYVFWGDWFGFSASEFCHCFLVLLSLRVFRVYASHTIFTFAFAVRMLTSMIILSLPNSCASICFPARLAIQRPIVVLRLVLLVVVVRVPLFVLLVPRRHARALVDIAHCVMQRRLHHVRQHASASGRLRCLTLPDQ
jgi:hypothetical protein